MATEVLTEQRNTLAEAKPESQIRIQFTTKLKELSLPEDNGPILVPTSEFNAS